jgi:hypothetical protein
VTKQNSVLLRENRIWESRRTRAIVAAATELDRRADAESALCAVVLARAAQADAAVSALRTDRALASIRRRSSILDLDESAKETKEAMSLLALSRGEFAKQVAKEAELLHRVRAPDLDSVFLELETLRRLVSSQTPTEFSDKVPASLVARFVRLDCELPVRLSVDDCRVIIANVGCAVLRLGTDVVLILKFYKTQPPPPILTRTQRTTQRTRRVDRRAEGGHVNLIRHELYPSCSFRDVTVAYLESLDVDEMHERTRRTLQRTPLWAFEHGRLTQVNGAPPSSAAVQLGLEIQMYAFCPAWRFTQQTLTTIVTIKGIALPVQQMLNHTAHILLSRDSQLRHNHACQRAWFLDTRLALSIDPSNTGTARHDNYTSTHKGSSASHGERRGERVTVGASCRPPTRDRPSKNTQKRFRMCRLRRDVDGMVQPAERRRLQTRARDASVDEQDRRAALQGLADDEPAADGAEDRGVLGHAHYLRAPRSRFLQRPTASSDPREHHTKIERKKRRKRYTGPRRAEARASRRGHRREEHGERRVPEHAQVEEREVLRGERPAAIARQVWPHRERLSSSRLHSLSLELFD